MKFTLVPASALAGALSFLTVLSCSSDTESTGEVSVRVDTEDIIASGIAAGADPDLIGDGWSVSFDRYVVSVGQTRLDDGSGEGATSGEVIMADLVQIGETGLELDVISGLEAGRFDVEFQLVSEGTKRHESIPTALFERLSDEGVTYSVAGTLEKESGISCPPTASVEAPSDRDSSGENDGGDSCFAAETISFEFEVDAEAVYGPCEIDGVPGIAVASGSTATAALSVHGDHLFFNGFPEGDEGGIQRLAQLADCDLDLNGEVSMEELEVIAPTDLHSLDDRFQLGGTPISPLESMADYVRAQLLTQVHFQGEGECPLRSIGQAGE